jgi:hypothetical protein
LQPRMWPCQLGEWVAPWQTRSRNGWIQRLEIWRSPRKSVYFSLVSSFWHRLTARWQVSGKVGKTAASSRQDGGVLARLARHRRTHSKTTVNSRQDGGVPARSAKLATYSGETGSIPASYIAMFLTRKE